MRNNPIIAAKMLSTLISGCIRLLRKLIKTALSKLADFRYPNAIDRFDPRIVARIAD
jgi:hypothetical protein